MPQPRGIRSSTCRRRGAYSTASATTGATRIARLAGAIEATSVRTPAATSSTPNIDPRDPGQHEHGLALRTAQQRLRARPAVAEAEHDAGDGRGEREGRALGDDHAAQLPSLEAERPQQAELPGALHDAERQRVHHADRGDEGAEADEHREDGRRSRSASRRCRRTPRAARAAPRGSSRGTTPSSRRTW